MNVTVTEQSHQAYNIKVFTAHPAGVGVGKVLRKTINIVISNSFTSLVEYKNVSVTEQCHLTYTRILECAQHTLSSFGCCYSSEKNYKYCDIKFFN